MSIKYFSLLFLFPLFVFGQTEEITLKKKNKTGFVQAGISYPIYLGDNVAAEVYEFKPGFYASAFLFVKPRILAGVIFNYTNYTSNNIEVTGFFNEGVMERVVFGVGYDFTNGQDITILATMGIGYANFINRSQGETFRDSGTSFYASGSASKNIIKNVDGFFEITFAYDALNVEAPPEISDFFNTAISFTPALGLRYHFN